MQARLSVPECRGASRAGSFSASQAPMASMRHEARRRRRSDGSVLRGARVRLGICQAAGNSPLVDSLAPGLGLVALVQRRCCGWEGLSGDNRDNRDNARLWRFKAGAFVLDVDVQESSPQFSTPSSFIRLGIVVPRLRGRDRWLSGALLVEEVVVSDLTGSGTQAQCWQCWPGTSVVEERKVSDMPAVRLNASLFRSSSSRHPGPWTFGTAARVFQRLDRTSRDSFLDDFDNVFQRR